MKIRSCTKVQLDRLMDKIGDAFDYAINDCKIAGVEFVKIFAASEVCKKIENGDVSCVLGKSGIEITIECVDEITGKELNVTPCGLYDVLPNIGVAGRFVIINGGRRASIRIYSERYRLMKY